jgi:hypothetical protein
MAQGYDPAKAALFNKLIQDGLSEDAAAKQAGITEADFGNYIIGKDGQLGPFVIGSGKKSGVNNTDNVDNGPPASSVKTTTTTTTSGGGTTTIVAGVDTPTPESKALQAQADATSSQIDKINRQLAPAAFGGSPNLTADQRATLQAQRAELYDQWNAQTDAAASATLPGTPTVTTTPNTTTTTTTTKFSSSSSDNPVGANDTQVGQEQIYSTSTPPPISQRKFTLPAADAALNNAADVKAAQDWLTASPTVRDRIEKSTGLSASEIQALAESNNLTGVKPTSSAANLPPDPFAAENASPFAPGSTVLKPLPIPGYVASFNADTQLWDVVDPATGAVVARNIPDEAQAKETAGLQASLGSATQVPVSSFDRSAAPVPAYVISFNADTQSWDVVNPETGAVIAGGFPDQASAQETADLQQSLVSSPPNPQPQATGQSPYIDPIGGLPYDEGDPPNLRPGWTLVDGKPVYVGGDFIAPATLASAEASRTAAATERARKQQAYIDQQRNLNNADWRVRLTLAPKSSYLYNVAQTDAGILEPLRASNGVIFPYTPQIATSYKANYSHYDLTHSNHRGYFYQNSYTDNVVITGTFTAQTLSEANYLLAVIHFFRSVTKMFYGQSPNVGSPPPVCFLNGLGEFQFNKHPVLVTNFSYTLPRDVDYIRTGSANNLQLNQNPLRAKSNTLNPQLASVQRLANALIKPPRNTPPPPIQPNTNNPTYVPTKMEIVVTLMPIQSRTQVSREFNLQTFANGHQLRGGFW